MKKVFLATSALASSVMFANSASALTSSFNATVDIADALAMSQNTQMNLGMAQTPGTSNVVIHLTQAGGNGTGTTATMIQTSTMAAGSYKITGSGTHSISINGTNGASVAGFTFTNLNCKYNAGTETDIIASSITSGAAPTSSGKNLVCGAKITVASTVTDGVYTPDLNVTVAYE